jgi:hypothetical protein
MDIGLTPGPVKAAAVNFKADKAAGKGKAHLGDAAAVGRAHGGWASGTANDVCISTWQDRLRSLSATVESAADTLSTSMDDYEATESAISTHLRQDATWLENS